MSELNRLEKVFRLITLLIGNRRTTGELADILECNVRTIQRYVQVIKAAGFVVEYHIRGVPYLETRKGRMKDISQLIHFTNEEAFILKKAIDSISSDTLLKQNLKRKLYSIYNFPEIVEIVVKPELGENVHRLIEAIRNEKSVILKGYHSANSNSISDRFVEPYQFTTNYAQVWCYDLKDHQCKLFTTTRIQMVEILEEQWKFKKHHIAARLDVFRNSGNLPVGTVKLLLNVRATALLTEEYPLSEKFIKIAKGSKSLFESEVFNFEGPARFVLGLFENIEVLGDENFKNFLRQKISAMKI